MIDVIVKRYAKYISLERIKQEKRDLLECLKDKIYLKDKDVFIKEEYVYIPDIKPTV